MNILLKKVIKNKLGDYLPVGAMLQKKYNQTRKLALKDTVSSLPLIYRFLLMRTILVMETAAIYMMEMGSYYKRNFDKTVR